MVATGYLSASSTHTHTAPTSGAVTSSSSSNAGTWNSASNDPTYRAVVWIRSDGTPGGFPSGAWAYWDNNAALPASWSLVVTAQSKFLKGAAAAGDGGATGGGAHVHAAAAHGHTSIANHTHSGGAFGGPSATASTNSGGGATTSAHTHAVTFAAAPGSVSIGNGTAADTSSTTYEPSYAKLATVQNDSGSNDLQVRHIALWLGLLSAIPGGWMLCDGSSGTVDMRGRFVKGAGALGEIGNTGGSAGHSHASGGAHTHTQSHVHSQTFAGDATNGGGSASSPSAVATQNHSHSATNSGANTTALSSADQMAPTTADTQPPFRTIAFIRFSTALEVAIEEPEDAAVLGSPSPLIEWSLVFNPPGVTPVQNDYRVRVFAADGVEVVYDSGTVASAAWAHQMPAGILHNDRTYFIRVDATDTLGLSAASALRSVTTSWAPPATITNVTAVQVGG